MPNALSDLLQLPKGSDKPCCKSEQAKAFRQKFTTTIKSLNSSLQSLATAAPPADYQQATAQRDKLYAAYQQVVKQIDAGKATADGPDAKRVLKAVETIAIKMAQQAKDAQAKQQQWLQQEPKFDDAMLKIATLEAAGHPKAPTLKKLGDGIRKQANQRGDQKATAALKQLEPKLDQIYKQHQASTISESGAKVVPATLKLKAYMSSNGNPVVGASVRVSSVANTNSPLDDPFKEITTDKQGLATLQVTPGTYNIEGTFNKTCCTLRNQDLKKAGKTYEVSLCDWDETRNGELWYAVHDFVQEHPIDGVTIQIDGAPIETNRSSGQIPLQPGEHTYHFAAKGYVPKSGKVKVAEGKTTNLKIELVSQDAQKQAAASSNDKTNKDSATATLEVHAKGHDGKAIAGVSVRVTDATGKNSQVQQATTNDKGIATFQVVPGQYQAFGNKDKMRFDGRVVETVKEPNKTYTIHFVGSDQAPPHGKVLFVLTDENSNQPIEKGWVKIDNDKEQEFRKGYSIPVAPGGHRYEVWSDHHMTTKGKVIITAEKVERIELKLKPDPGNPPPSSNANSSQTATAAQQPAAQPKAAQLQKVRLDVSHVVDKGQGASSLQPIEGANVKSGDKLVKTDRKGFAFFDLPAGKHTFEASAQGYNSAKVTEEVTVTGGVHAYGIELKKQEKDAQVDGSASKPLTQKEREQFEKDLKEMKSDLDQFLKDIDQAVVKIK